MPRPTVSPSPLNRPATPARPAFEFRIDAAGVLPKTGTHYIEGQVIGGAVMRGSTGIVMVDGEAHGLVVQGAVLGLHEQTLRGIITLCVQRPAFDLDAIAPGTVFASDIAMLARKAA